MRPVRSSSSSRPSCDPPRPAAGCAPLLRSSFSNSGATLFGGGFDGPRAADASRRGAIRGSASCRTVAKVGPLSGPPGFSESQTRFVFRLSGDRPMPRLCCKTVLSPSAVQTKCPDFRIYRRKMGCFAILANIRYIRNLRRSVRFDGVSSVFGCVGLKYDKKYSNDAKKTCVLGLSDAPIPFSGICNQCFADSKIFIYLCDAETKQAAFFGIDITIAAVP